jgi:DNA oxidative demethylase
MSLGLPATFPVWGAEAARSGAEISGSTRRCRCAGRRRLACDGIAELKDGDHPLLGKVRINLTFRRAL